MTVRSAQILLIAVICTRATALMFSKMLLVDVGPFALLGVRFLLAFALLALIFHRRLAAMNRRTFCYGLGLGAGFFVVMALEMFALRLTATSHVAFLENTAIVFVPIVEAVIARRLPTIKVCLGAGAALLGIGLICLGGSAATLNLGDLLALVAAFFYTAVIIMCARMSRKEDAIVLGVMQVGWIGAFGAVAGLACQEPVAIASGQQWMSLAVLVIACTGFGFTLQPLAQRHLSSEQASLTIAVDPLVASMLGILVLGEQVGAAGYLGMALILASIVASCLPERTGRHLAAPKGA